MELTPKVRYINIKSNDNLYKNKVEILNGKVLPLFNTYNWRKYNDKVFYGSLVLRIDKLYSNLKDNISLSDDFDLSFYSNHEKYNSYIEPLPTKFINNKIEIDLDELDNWYENAIMIAKRYDNDNQYNIINNIPKYIQDIDKDILLRFVKILGNYLDDKRLLIKYQNYFNKKDTYDGNLMDNDILTRILLSKGINIKSILNIDDYDIYYGRDTETYLETNDHKYIISNILDGVDISLEELNNRIDYFKNNFNTIIPYNLNAFGYNSSVVKQFSRNKEYSANNLLYQNTSGRDSILNIKKRFLSDYNSIIKSKSTYISYKIISNILGLDTNTYKIYNYYDNHKDSIETTNSQISYVKLNDNLNWNWDSTYQAYSGAVQTTPNDPNYKLSWSFIIDDNRYLSQNIEINPLNLGGKIIRYEGESLVGKERLSQFNDHTNYLSGMKYIREGKNYIINDSIEEEVYELQDIYLERTDIYNKWCDITIYNDEVTINVDNINYKCSTQISSNNPFDMMKVNEGMIPYIGVNNIRIEYQDKVITYPLGIDNTQDIHSDHPHNSFVNNIKEFKKSNRDISHINKDYSLKKYTTNNLGNNSKRIDIGYNIGRIIDKYIDNKLNISSDQIYFHNDIINAKKRRYFNDNAPTLNINTLLTNDNYKDIRDIYGNVNPLNTALIIGNIIETPTISENINNQEIDTSILISLDQDILTKNYIFNEYETVNNTSLNIYDEDDRYKLKLT